ncbi:hypothetical protein PG993_008010 [Apiospora rasikravindrae]|uniref:Uncharacterized protein n=1 Tax=Apiospora rasikravindrae TaxID=990691 RepID=A0ABR1SZ48_9PEZI
MSTIHVTKTHSVSLGTPKNARSTQEKSLALQSRSVSNPTPGSATISFRVQEQGSETVTMVHLSATEINNIGNRLAAARANAELPDTTAPDYNLEIMYQDYQRLLYLQRLRGDTNQPPTDDYNSAFVEVNREIAQRDIQFRQAQRETETNQRMENIREHLNEQVRQHNARQAAYEAITAAVSNGQAQNVEASVVMNEIRTAIQTMAGTQSNGVDGTNMDAVMEEVFATIETALLDAAGPLRLNNQQYNQNNARFGSQIDNLGTQLGAMNNHVSAVSNHVSALGALVHSVNTITNSTNGQMAQVSDQVHTLQDVIRMLPAVVDEAIQRNLSAAIQAAMGPALMSALSTGLKRVPPSPSSPTGVHKKARRGFFGFFKRSRKDTCSATVY